MAKKPNPTPASRVVNSLANQLTGATSPNPSVKKVVPLKYKYMEKPGDAESVRSCEKDP
jgi:hypothetical protein